MTNVKTIGANALTWAALAGAALLFLEVTLAPVIPVAPARTATVQTITVAAHPDRIARN